MEVLCIGLDQYNDQITWRCADWGLIQAQAKLRISHNEFLDSSQLSLNMERKERRTISAGNLQEGDGGLHHFEDSATSWLPLIGLDRTCKPPVARARVRSIGRCQFTAGRQEWWWWWAWWEVGIGGACCGPISTRGRKRLPEPHSLTTHSSSPMLEMEGWIILQQSL